MPLIRVTVQPSGMQKEFDVPEGGAPCDVLALQLKEEFGSGSLHHASSHTALLPLANVYLQAGDYDYRTFAAAAAAAAAAAPAAGAPILYKDVVLHIAGGGNSTDEFVRPYALVSRATLQKVLDMQGCDAVLTLDTKQLVSFDAIELHDNMVLTALRSSVPWDARVSTLEGFVESSVKGFEEDATEAVFQHLQQEHSSAKVLPIRHVTSVDGKKREVDGAVVADGCAAILEAKQVLDDSAVPQLASCIEFIRNNELVGPAAELKGKKLLGFLAGRTLSSDPGKAQALVRDCRQHSYGIFVSSGRLLGLGNSRVPHLRVNCAMYKRACGASSCAVRMV